jgi:maleylacetate reductase
MQDFVYHSAPMRVVFGAGTLRQLPEELTRLGVSRALVLATPRQTAQVADISELIGGRAAGVFTGAVMHTPVDVTEQAMAKVRELNADCVIAIGGGSTTGLGKAIALRTDLPQIVLPTSYAGSEMTPILGETRGGIKTTQSSPKILPEVVIYDVDLTMAMPARLSATSGINAIAHAVEALYARDRNPIISLMAQEGIGTLAHALPRICAQPNDKAARSDAL